MINFIKNILRLNNSANRTSTEPLKQKINKEDIWLSDLIKSWKATDLKLNEPASDDLIIETQENINFDFPIDFIKFYKQFNGFKDWDVIGNMFSIWTLERLNDEYEKCDDKSFIPFCDYLIDSHRIGFLKNQTGIFKDFDQSNPIANSFEETIGLIIEDSELLY